MKRSRLSVCLVIAVLLGAVAWPLCSRWIAASRLCIERQSVTDSDGECIALACADYFEIFGNYPSGSSAAISKALAGDNPKKEVLLHFERVNKEGAMLDPWHTPYAIQIADDGALQIRSAGPNRSMGDADDKLRNYRLADMLQPLSSGGAE